MQNKHLLPAAAARAWAALFLALTGVALVALSNWPNGAPRVHALVNCDTGTAAMDAEETQALALMNAERAAAGLGPLKVSPSLSRAAAWKSEDNVAHPPLSHTDSLGRNTVQQPPGNRAIDCGYRTWAGENVAVGFGTAQSVVTAWMGSSGHRANILGKDYKVAGIGKVGSMWTAVYGVADDSGDTSTPPTSVATATKTPTKMPTTGATAATSTPTASPTPTRTPTLVPTATPTLAPIIAEVTLDAGFNLATYAGPQRAPAQAFASIDDVLRAAYLWDAVNERWYRYLPGAPAYASNLDAVRPGDAVFLDLAAPETWKY
ncbi:hypothetical protein AYO38_06760 [bacterium SCGC AG-212-C10]|nr:hypothetical protein AYO38_06760 [bacterium SCGC AG-212-C10]